MKKRNQIQPRDAVGTKASIKFLNDVDRFEVEKKQGHNLPHWTLDGAIYHVRFRLVDSLPAGLRRELQAEKERLNAVVNNPGQRLTLGEKKRLLYLYTKKIEGFLDAGYGKCWLILEEIAALVADALKYFDGDRYKLFAWCVMPNHVHVVVQPLSGFNLPEILHSWKSYTSKKANLVLGGEGKFWQKEYYDRVIRDREELDKCVEYVYLNPEKAGFVDWMWRFRVLEVIEAKIQPRDAVGT